MRTHFYSCRKTLDKTQWMKKEELQQLQMRKLKMLLRHAYENVPYYHELFRKSGFRPTDFGKLEDLQKIPVLRRSDLRSKLNELVARNVKKSELVSCKTSGTTATPLKFYQSKTEIPWYLAAEARGYSWARYKTGDKVIYLRILEPNDALARLMARITRFIRRWKLMGGYNLSEKSMLEFCSKNRNFKPDFVHGGGGPLNIFGVFLQENTQYSLRPKAVFSYGQQLLPDYRKMIEEAFRCKVYDIYSSTEVPYVAAQCGHHEGLHVAEENVFLEVEKDGEAAVPGEEGKVLLTSLNGYAMPFIRYDVGDRGKMFADDCPCGRGLLLFRPLGRTYEYFVHSDGTFTIFRDIQTVFEDLPIEDYQIVQQTLDEIAIRIVKRAGYTQAHTDFIMKKISLIVSDRVKIRVELVDSVPLIGFGKVPRFVSKIPTKYT
jgi:phenylacetate-CoA ligase